MTESLMLALTARGLARADAHELLRGLTRNPGRGPSLAERAKAEPAVARLLTREEVDRLLDPAAYVEAAAAKTDRVIATLEAELDRVTDRDPGWTAVIAVVLPDPESARWLEAALGPEATRDVPRANAEIRRAGPHRVELHLTARDTGSLRAAMNTYLGWVHLTLSTASAARRIR